MNSNSKGLVNLAFVLVMTLFLIGFILSATGCTASTVEAAPELCSDYEAYKIASTVSINRSAATYVDYVTGRMDYKGAELRASIIYLYATRELACENMEEHVDVLMILRNTRDAIQSHHLSSPAIANGYLDDAFNRIRVLNADWGWDI